MQLARLDIDVAREDIVEDNILDKGRFVVLFIVKRLDAVDRYRREPADALCKLVLAMDEDRVLKTRAAPGKGFVCHAADTYHIVGIRKFARRVLAHLADARKLRARNDGAGRIDHAHGAVNRVFHLQNDALKKTCSHIVIILYCIFKALLILSYSLNRLFSSINCSFFVICYKKDTITLSGRLFLWNMRASAAVCNLPNVRPSFL